MVHTCKHSIAMMRKVRNNYKDLISGWSKTTGGWPYGKIAHMTIDIGSLLIMKWLDLFQVGY